jgi:hypothetical protein
VFIGIHRIKRVSLNTTTFRETRLNNQINDKSTVKPNIIFDTTVKLDPHRGIHNALNAQ